MAWLPRLCVREGSGTNKRVSSTKLTMWIRVKQGSLEDGVVYSSCFCRVSRRRDERHPNWVDVPAMRRTLLRIWSRPRGQVGINIAIISKNLHVKITRATPSTNAENHTP